MPITSILKVDDPSCIWGQLYSGPGGDTETVEQYDLLMAQMNLFYGDATQDPGKLRAASLGDGQVCVVYWSATGSWCRALVESIAHDSVSRKARCFLVDHGERLIVSSDQIRVAMENFLQLPFLVKKFHLAKIKPTTLRVSFLEKAKLIPSAQWDSSATLYLHNLLQVSTQTEAVMLEHELESIPIMLYVTVRNIKICVNDDLVTKKFALYDGEAAGGAWQDECPVTSSCGVLTQMASGTPSAATAPPASATSRSRAVAADRPPSTPQSRPRRLQVSEERRRSPDSQSESGSDAAAKTDSSEETSLAAALTESLSLVRLRKFLNPGSSCSVGRHEELRDSGPEGRTAASAGQEVYAASAPPTAQWGGIKISAAHCSVIGSETGNVFGPVPECSCISTVLILSSDSVGSCVQLCKVNERPSRHTGRALMRRGSSFGTESEASSVSPGVFVVVNHRLFKTRPSRKTRSLGLHNYSSFDHDFGDFNI